MCVCTSGMHVRMSVMGASYPHQVGVVLCCVVLCCVVLCCVQSDSVQLSLHCCLQVARCTKIINADTDDPKYIINVKQFAKFVVNLHKNLAPTDVEEGMRVG